MLILQHYMLDGVRPTVFAHLVNLNHKIVKRQACKVANEKESRLYDFKHKIAHHASLGIQRIVLYCFLQVSSFSYELECLRGRGSSEDKSLRLLPCTWTKVYFHDRLVAEWEEILNAALYMKPHSTRSTNPIYNDLFVR